MSFQPGYQSNAHMASQISVNPNLPPLILSIDTLSGNGQRVHDIQLSRGSGVLPSQTGNSSSETMPRLFLATPRAPAGNIPFGTMPPTINPPSGYPPFGTMPPTINSTPGYPSSGALPPIIIPIPGTSAGYTPFGTVPPMINPPPGYPWFGTRPQLMNSTPWASAANVQCPTHSASAANVQCPTHSGTAEQNITESVPISALPPLGNSTPPPVDVHGPAIRVVNSVKAALSLLLRLPDATFSLTSEDKEKLKNAFREYNSCVLLSPKDPYNPEKHLILHIPGKQIGELMSKIVLFRDGLIDESGFQKIKKDKKENFPPPPYSEDLEDCNVQFSRTSLDEPKKKDQESPIIPESEDENDLAVTAAINTIEEKLNVKDDSENKKFSQNKSLVNVSGYNCACFTFPPHYAPEEKLALSFSKEISFSQFYDVDLPDGKEPFLKTFSEELFPEESFDPQKYWNLELSLQKLDHYIVKMIKTLIKSPNSPIYGFINQFKDLALSSPVEIFYNEAGMVCVRDVIQGCLKSLLALLLNNKEEVNRLARLLLSLWEALPIHRGDWHMLVPMMNDKGQIKINFTISKY